MAQEGTLTVEGIVHKALHESGAISESNAYDRRKIKWSSASRTDKGVHAAACFCSAKLVLDKAVDAAVGKNGMLPASLLDTWNHKLPPDIRILGALKWGKNSRAHSLCSLREYEYLLPESALHGKPPEELGRLLTVFEGTHRFHNFTGNLTRLLFACCSCE